MQNYKKKCYMCDNEAISVEHVPPKCFFPKGKRENLITVPSCDLHNNHTAMDDEYVRGIVVSSYGNNETANFHWKNSVRKSYLNSPKLFLKTFKVRLDDSFFHDRNRVDSVMVKIAYGLYYHIYKRTWTSQPSPFYNRFLLENGMNDIQYRLPNYKQIPYEIFDGTNKEVFKYQYFEGRINGEPNCYFRLVFYEGFEVIIMPVKDNSAGARLILDLMNK